jgi:hypothetical protein
LVSELVVHRCCFLDRGWQEISKDLETVRLWLNKAKLARALSWAVQKLISQQFSLAPLWFQNPVAAKHNNSQDKPVEFESRSSHSPGTGSMDCIRQIQTYSSKKLIYNALASYFD